MQPIRPEPLRQRRSRIFITIFLLVILGLSIAAALIIKRGLADDSLQEDLRELREERG